MNSKNTWLWFVLAVAVFAAISFLDHHFHAPPAANRQGWPDFQLAEASSIQVIPSGALEIRADRTNDTWNLSEPIAYPAQTPAIAALLDSLGRLTPDARITASDLRQQPTAEQDYGFDVPQYSLVIETPHNQWQLKIGRRTAPGNQVYLRVVGVDGAFVTDAGWLKYLPPTANAWRDTSLVSADGRYDSIVLTNGTKVIELHQDPTNHLWRMTRPLQARADSERINQALQALRSGRVESFVTDDAKTDLTAYELQPADLDLWLGRGGLSEGLHLGKTLTNNPALVFARREGWNGVITTLNEPLAVWRGAVNDFRDPHLFDLPSPANEIEVRGADEAHHFILQRQGSNVWHEVGQTFPVDAKSVQYLLKLLAGMKATEFVNDAVTAPDLQNYGLTKSDLQITLRPVVGDTNQTMAQVSFSPLQNDHVFARRSDEDSIYEVNKNDAQSIPPEGWQYRDRGIWNFKEPEVSQIIIRQDGQTRQILHNGRNDWTLAPGSPGQVYGPAIEETAHELGELSAILWVWSKITDPVAFGVTTNSLEIEADLKNGQKRVLDMGNPISGQPVALVTLDGVRWAFIVPQSDYQLILSYLTIPANVH